LFHNKSLKNGAKIRYDNISEILEKDKRTLRTRIENGKNYYNYIIPVRGLHNNPIAAVIIGFPASLITQKTAQMATCSVGASIIFLVLGGISLMILL
jgi:hypothetical protein